MTSSAANSLGAFLVVVIVSIVVECQSSSYQPPTCAGIRLRRDWKSLALNEQQNFANVFVDLVNSYTYQNSFSDRYGNLLFSNSISVKNSLLFHRVFLLELEDAMRTRLGDPNFALPYGDWEPLFNNPTSFDQPSFGNQGNSFSSMFVSTLFSSLNFYYFVSRTYANPVKKVNEDDYRNAVGTPTFTKFNSLITQGLQSIINDNYGGSMVGTTSGDNPAKDPLWILHQANIQRIFQTWQLQNPSVSYPFDDLDDMLPGYDSVYSQSVWSPSVGCVNYDTPSYSPVDQIVNGANVIFGGPFGDDGGFWGFFGKKKRIVSGASCSFLSNNLKFQRGSAFSLLELKYNVSLESPSNSYLKRYFDSVTKTINFDGRANYLQQVKSKIDFGIGFDFAVAFADLLQSFDELCYYPIKFGAKYKPGKPEFFISKVLIELQYNSDLRTLVDRAANIFTRASNRESPGDIPTQSKLQDLGKELFIQFLTVISPATPLNNPLNITAQFGWLCPQGWFGSGDGCDCNCGYPDPDCTPQTSIYSSPVPVFGCWDFPSAQCINDQCIQGPSPPPEWICPPQKYNNSDGCDCACGAHDPDCDLVYSGNYAQIAPDLYEIIGCYGGKGAFCSNGNCEYETVVPAGWLCATDIYSDGVTCDCSCGAYDPDCDNSTAKAIGCACSEQRCQNQYGLCEGQCGGVGVQVSVSTVTPTQPTVDLTQPTAEFTEQPSVCPRTSGGAKANEEFLNLLNFMG